MTSNWAKPAKGKHIFVVLRRDDFIDDAIESITGTKAFVSRERAQVEVDRMNAVIGGKGARYFVRLVRLQGDRA